MDKEDEFNEAMKGFFFSHKQHHNAWGAYEFEPQMNRGKRPYDPNEYDWKGNPIKEQGVISIIHTPPKVKPEAHNKFRRFRKDLKVENIGIKTQLGRLTVGFSEEESFVLKVNDEIVEVPYKLSLLIKAGYYIISELSTYRFTRIRPQSKVISLTRLFYLCIVESQYIQFEEV